MSKPINVVRGMLNSMHIAHAINFGHQTGLFKSLSDNEKPVTVSEFVQSREDTAGYVQSWLRVMQSVGIVVLTDDERITFGDGWREACTDENSSQYIPHLVECHIQIASYYPRFPSLFWENKVMSPHEQSLPLLRSITADGVRFANYFIRSVVAMIPSLQRQLEKGIDVLDVGCGGGRFLLTLAAAYPRSRYKGIDILPNAIDIANEEMNNRSDQLRDVSFAVMNATELESNSADFIILNEVLHEMDWRVRRDALTKCYNALRAGGILYMVDILAPDDSADYASDGGRLSALVQFFEAPWGARVLHMSELEKLMSDAGFGTLNHVSSEDSVVSAYVKRK